MKRSNNRPVRLIDSAAGVQGNRVPEESDSGKRPCRGARVSADMCQPPKDAPSAASLAGTIVESCDADGGGIDRVAYDRDGSEWRPILDTSGIGDGKWHLFHMSGSYDTEHDALVAATNHELYPPNPWSAV